VVVGLYTTPLAIFLLYFSIRFLVIGEGVTEREHAI
jgi:hypothetical protein